MVHILKIRFKISLDIFLNQLNFCFSSSTRSKSYGKYSRYMVIRCVSLHNSYNIQDIVVLYIFM